MDYTEYHSGYFMHGKSLCQGGQNLGALSTGKKGPCWGSTASRHFHLRDGRFLSSNWTALVHWTFFFSAIHTDKEEELRSVPGSRDNAEWEVIRKGSVWVILSSAGPHLSSRRHLEIISGRYAYFQRWKGNNFKSLSNRYDLNPLGHLLCIHFAKLFWCCESSDVFLHLDCQFQKSFHNSRCHWQLVKSNTTSVSKQINNSHVLLGLGTVLVLSIHLV